MGKKKLPLGTFFVLKAGPKPARVVITLLAKYLDKAGQNPEAYNGLAGFKIVGSTKQNQTMILELPVTPPTVKIAFGSQTDSSNIVQTGEVVLPKYKKAEQLRWESFFPYDSDANYLNTNVRSTFGDLVGGVSKIVDTIKSLKQKSNIPSTIINSKDIKPSRFVELFKILNTYHIPFLVSLIYYEGGHLKPTPYTIDTFDAYPETNGDYQYSISLVEYTEISPKILDAKGQVMKVDNTEVTDHDLKVNINTLSKLIDFCKKAYGSVSKALIFALTTYNNVKGVVFSLNMSVLKIKGLLRGLVGRCGILDNVLGKSKITRNDTKAVCASLKSLSQTKASAEMADFLYKNKKI